MESSVLFHAVADVVECLYEQFVAADKQHFSRRDVYGLNVHLVFYVIFLYIALYYFSSCDDVVHLTVHKSFYRRLEGFVFYLVRLEYTASKSFLCGISTFSCHYHITLSKFLEAIDVSRPFSLYEHHSV